MTDEDYQRGQADADQDCEKKLKEIRDHLNGQIDTFKQILKGMKEIDVNDKFIKKIKVFEMEARIEALTQVRDWLEEKYFGEEKC